ncbi:putative mitochondrial outer membrane protein [Cladorrhinum sp. PSN259]|nr:putative mitochondrial outer membrane protein [Cladorrhinum sp. PSN259]
MSDISSFLFNILPPCHLIVYSTLLGTQLYQTFVMTKVSYNALSRPAFRTLQKRVFPLYFKAQACLVLLNAITFPASGPGGLATNKADWIPHLIAGVTAILNLSIYEPRTRRSMIQVAHQEARDAQTPPKAVASDSERKEKEDSEPPPELLPVRQAAKKQFSRDHAMCIHLNLITIVATVIYGLRLASRVDVVAPVA